MKIQNLISQLNSSLPSKLELINYYRFHGLEVSDHQALEEISNETIKYNIEFENDLYRAFFVEKVFKRLAFFTFTEPKKYNPKFIECGVFLESDPVYYDINTKEVFVQKPGFYFLDYPTLIVKGFDSLESFLEVLVTLEVALRGKMYRNKKVKGDVLTQILNLNSPDCKEFLVFLFENIRDFY
jgi:hypothetical protein